MNWDWKRRLRELALAGGSLAVAGCIPCGNANPDPCICGRPDSNAAAKAACDVKNACEAKGEAFNDDWQSPACVEDAGATDLRPTDARGADGGG